MGDKATGARLLAALGVLLLVASVPASAEEMYKKWRIEVKVGGVDPGDEIRSEAANSFVLELENPGGEDIRQVVGDPRPNEISTIEGRLASGTRWDIRASYGIASFKNSELILDFGIGHYKTRVNNLELTYALDISDPNYLATFGTPPEVVWRTPVEAAIYAGYFDQLPEPDPFGDPGPFFRSMIQDTGGEAWRYVPINAGEITNYPVSVNLLMRFRPTKKLNPYFGGGVGYQIVDFEASDQWKRIADQMDASIVMDTQAVPGGALQGQRTLPGLKEFLDTVNDPEVPVDPTLLSRNFRDFERPEVIAEDSLFLEVRGGFEWQWRPKTSFFLETTFSWADKEIRILMDGREKLGEPAPDGIIVDANNPSAYPVGGLPAYIVCGGITEFLDQEPIQRDVSLQAPGGGRTSIDYPCPGSGEYFFNGGKLDYGGFTWQAGVRFTL